MTSPAESFTRIMSALLPPRVATVNNVGRTSPIWNYPDYAAFRDHSENFDGLVAYSGTSPYGFSVQGEDSGRPATLAYGLMVLIGAAAGIPAAHALSRFLESMLYGITPADPLAFVIATLVLLGVSALASWTPARRATGIDPVAALRCE